MFQGFKTQLQRNLRQRRSQRRLRFLEFAYGHQQLDVFKAGVVIRRVDGQRLLQLGQRRICIAFGQQIFGGIQVFFGQQLIFARQMLVQKLAQLAFGQSAHETVDRLAVHHQHASRYAAYTECLRKLLLVVGVDLHQLETPGVVELQFFQHRAQRFARPAPRCPEVQQHRDLGGSHNNFGFKILNSHINHGCQVHRNKISQSVSPDVLVRHFVQP